MLTQLVTATIWALTASRKKKEATSHLWDQNSKGGTNQLPEMDC
jgi:hypothetical protein